MLGSFSPGDVALLMPRNRSSLVHDMLQWLECDANVLVRLQRRGEVGSELPAFFRQHEQEQQDVQQMSRPVTLQCLFERYLDIGGVPKRYFFELLSFFAANEMEKEKLAEFATTAGQVCVIVLFYLCVCLCVCVCACVCVCVFFVFFCFVFLVLVLVFLCWS